MTELIRNQQTYPLVETRVLSFRLRSMLLGAAALPLVFLPGCKKEAAPEPLVVDPLGASSRGTVA